MPPLTPARQYAKPKAAYNKHHGRKHQKLRAQLLAAFPVCQYAFDGICTGWATEADHLVYPAICIDHYKATCKQCHKERHRMEKNANS